MNTPSRPTEPAPERPGDSADISAIERTIIREVAYGAVVCKDTFCLQIPDVSPAAVNDAIQRLVRKRVLVAIGGDPHAPYACFRYNSNPLARLGNPLRWLRQWRRNRAAP